MGWKVSSGDTQSRVNSTAWQQRQQSIQSLAKALQTNDIQSAKTAFESLKGRAPAGAQVDPNSPFMQLDQALKAGDLGAAQQAFSNMRGNHQRASIGNTITAVQPPVTAATETKGNFVNTYA